MGILSSILVLATAFQVGPFYQQRDDGYCAVRPFYAHEGKDTDVLWPLYTQHEDWWRFLLFIHGQDTQFGGYQYDLLPLCWWGRESGDGSVDTDGEYKGGASYWGLFPLYGTHPHIYTLEDFEFALWPLYTRYRTQRVYGNEKRRMASTAVLFPFFSWRDDGSWGFWPLYGINHQRESDHRYALWPIVTWANYRADRDTAGAGYSWMLFPLWGEVRREREWQTMVIPPLFAYAETPKSWYLRCPWPFFERQVAPQRERISVWPFYEHDVNYTYGEHEVSSEVTRFGWKLVELYDDETRVFPFWVSRKDDSYFRFWPFWESQRVAGDGEADASGDGERKVSRFLCLLPIRWSAAVDRNWAKFWTLYEREETAERVHHSLLWGIIQWNN